jgi:thioredoxin-dependent peroxiredoxin
MPKTGDPAPDFTAPSDSGERVSLRDLRGRKVVLYFYSKDETPGCTKEACDFRDNYTAISGKGAVLLGASVDSVESHKGFREHHNLPFTLISDSDKSIVQQYGVWRERERDGQKVMGTARTTFVIDEVGKIAKVFESVNPEGHAKEVLAAL